MRRLSPGSANRRDQVRRCPGRTSSPLWSNLRFSVHTGRMFEISATHGSYGLGVLTNVRLIDWGEILKSRSVRDAKSAG
jgi:hypothetical protein